MCVKIPRVVMYSNISGNLIRDIHIHIHACLKLLMMFNSLNYNKYSKLLQIQTKRKNLCLKIT